MKEFIKIYIGFLALGLMLYAYGHYTKPTNISVSPVVAVSTAPAHTSIKLPGADDDGVLWTLNENHVSGIQVEGSGVVSRILPDDTHGRWHQRFILTLSSGQTILIAHNIELAPRINDLQPGDRVWFYGEYEWNEKGGVVHWTHHDPAARHVSGWLKHKGKIYQ